jgi:tripartite-type tricarboxylate transporter receptor subunit TctC
MRFKKSMQMLSVCALAAHTQASPAQSPYPSKPVRIVVAFAAGGYADRVARLIGQKIGERLGQPMVIDNRGGAGGNIAARNVAESPADGYTLLAHTAAAAINASLYKDAGFELEKDLLPVAMTGSTPGLFTVVTTHPAGNLRDLIASARASDKPLAYATPGVGTSSHLAAEYLFGMLAGIQTNHIPFKGGAPATTAVLGGQVELLSASMGGALPFIKQGKLKALAVSSLTRIDELPNVPTVTEMGFPGFEERSWVGFFTPAKTPMPIVLRLNGEINRALAIAEVKATLVSQGNDVTPLSQPAFAEKVSREIALWRKVVNATGAKPE